MIHFSLLVSEVFFWKGQQWQNQGLTDQQELCLGCSVDWMRLTPLLTTLAQLTLWKPANNGDKPPDC